MPLQQSVIVQDRVSYLHYFLCNYLPVSLGADPLSLSLLKFKRGRQPDLDSWIACAVDLLGKIEVGSDTVLVRALRHDEVVVREDFPGALDKLGKALAARWHCRYCPGLLQKQSETQEMKYLTREERRSALTECYRIDSHWIDTNYSSAPVRPVSSSVSTGPAKLDGVLRAPSFLVLDDILTTGITLQVIIAALILRYPQARIAAFTLAKAKYDDGSSGYSVLKEYLSPVSAGGSSLFAEEEREGYFSTGDREAEIRRLEATIRADAFPRS